MIPREILKKIRQIELRTNRLVTETLADFFISAVAAVPPDSARREKPKPRRKRHP